MQTGRRLSKQLGGATVHVLNAATVIEINDTVVKPADEFLQEPVGALVPKPRRSIILSAKNRKEQADKLMPHHEMETAHPDFETGRNRNHKIKKRCKDNQHNVAAHHIGPRLRHGRIQGM